MNNNILLEYLVLAIFVSLNVISYKVVLLEMIMIILLAGVLRKRIKKFKLNKQEKWMMFYCLYPVFISLFNFRDNTIECINVQFCVVIFQVLFLLLIVKGFELNREFILILLKNFVILTTPVGILEYVSRVSIMSYLPKPFIQTYSASMLSLYRRISTFFGHPIVYGVVLLCALVIAYFYPSKNVIVDIVSKLLLIINLLMTQSRSTLLGVGFCIILLIIGKFMLIIESGLKIYKSTIPKMLIIFGIAMLSLFALRNSNIVMNLVSAVLTRIASATNNTSSDQWVRVSVVNAVVSYVTNYKDLVAIFLGKGLGYSASFCQILFDGILSNWQNTDNQYIYDFLNFGIVGLIPHLILLYYSIKSVLTQKDRLSACGGLILASIDVTIFFFDGLDGWRSIVFIWAFAVILIGKNRNPREKKCY